MPMSVSETVRIAKISLEKVAGEEAAQQAKLLIAAVLGVEPGALMVHTWAEVTNEQMETIGELLERRTSGEPLQYILGEWSFMGLPFITDERALIPRQDTELLCETAITLIKERNYQTCLDLCTGSGCIAISIAKRTGISVTATDSSADALSLTQENAELNEVSVARIECDLFDGIEGKFDLITCNPPYLDNKDMEELQQEIRYEPKQALYGGEDGLDFYRRIARSYFPHLNPGGVLLLEIGSTQADSVRGLFGEKTRLIHDICDNPRVVVVEY